MKNQKIHGGETTCRHNWSIRAKVPLTIHVSACTICGAERIMHDIDGLADTEVIKKVRAKGIELNEVE